MPENGEIVSVFEENGFLCMAAAAQELEPDPAHDPASGTPAPMVPIRREYMGRVPLAEILALDAVAGNLSDVETNAAKRKAVRDRLRDAVNDDMRRVRRLMRGGAPQTLNLGGKSITLQGGQ